MSKIIGIDLGTSNSAAAVMLGGKPTIIPAAEGVSIGGKTTPSYVAFTKDGQILVGEPARRQAALNPEGTITAIKRKMGTKEKIKVFGKEYTPQQISAFILQKIKKDAEAFLGEPVEKAVITVPAYFNDDQRQATKDAGAIAGLDVVRLVNEPTAAAFAYGLDKADKNLKIMVIDFGGGTLDVTIMDFGGGVFEVVSTSGDTQLGGTDMDRALFDYVCDEFQRQEGIDLRKDAKVEPRLREACEKAKIELSTVLETEINLPFITVDSTGTPKHLTMKITRAKLESLVKPIVDKIRGPMEQALRDAKLTPTQIDKIILVGGPTRMPIVQKTIEEYMGKQVERGIDPMECVAMGAAIQGAIISGEVKNVVLVDVTPLSLGIETLGGVFTKMIERNSPIPTSKTQVFTTAADNQTAVEINVLQGERPMAADNLSLGKFILDGIPPAPRGVPQIEVTYSIDENGIVNVSAKDKATGKEQHITITNASKLNKEDIERMKNEAEQFKEQDRKRMEEVELKNRADTLIYTARKTINDFKGKVDNSLIEDAEKSINELENLIKENKISELQAKIDEVSNKISKIGEQAYKSQETTGAAGGQSYSTGENTSSETSSEGNEGPTVEGKATEE
ncbi:MAG: molecular chaperone DnaK [Caldisericia bacterium]|jgi:molecular chaperone DnaK|nr:molecular chaperone DnaK [Caldisericia bacterium]MDD5689021.1 molecular chaperone DnaK [Caldisericia bacterium]HOJ15948.1 molecular chaperone DnaK [Caldisericia bacterium]HOW02877.1 molecular chaperone DnaK [Caldisericia bacterium]HQG81899.1 molecular chaperone DnaK [Caldisericia bacterium]